MLRIQYLPHDSLSGVMRVYDVENPGPMADYSLVCTINWKEDDPEKDVWIHGLMGKGRMSLWRKFAEEFHRLGFKRIRAFRVDDRSLPKARQLEDGSWVMEISDFIRDPPGSNFAPI